MAVTSRQVVRTGIAQFFGGTSYDTEARAYRGNGPLQANGVSSVRAYQPKRISDVDYVKGQATGRGMGAYMIVELPGDVETRRTIPAVTGHKRVTYSVTLHVFHLAYQPHAEDAEADLDAVIEAVKDLIHTDPTLGANTFQTGVYQAGENNFGIRVRVFPSSLLKEEILASYATVQFEAEVEIIA